MKIQNLLNWNVLRRVATKNVNTQDSFPGFPKFSCELKNVFKLFVHHPLLQVYPPTPDVEKFKRDTLGLVFESFDGGRDSKERLTQGKTNEMN